MFDADLRVEPDSWLEGKELREVLAATEGRMRIIDVRVGQRPFRDRSCRRCAWSPATGSCVQDTVENLKEFETVLKTALHDVDELDEADAKTARKEARATRRREDGEERDARAERAGAGAGKTVPAGARLRPMKASRRRAREADEKADEKDDETEEDAKKSRNDDAHPDVIVAQFVITPESPIEGRTARQYRLAEHYRLAVVGLQPVRAGHGWARKEITDRVLGAGDILLVQGSEDQLIAAQHDGIGLLLDSRHVVPRQAKAPVAIATMAVVVLLAATKTLPIGLAALGGVLALLATRAISWQDVGNSLSTKVIMLVAASLALGSALSITGGTAFLAQQLVGLAGAIEPRYLLALLMLLMGLFTNFVSNNASAAIGTPLGIEMARALGVPPEPYVLAVLFGCNLCYLTPMGYQTNLLVMNAAGYRFSDFVKVGTPLFVIMWAALCAVLVLRYGL